MSLSLCICTMNRPADLRRALQSIRDGHTQPHEVIVSDDGRSADTKALASEFGAVYVEGPQLGLSANRNLCLDVATGTHIAFIDDDVTVPAEFIDACHAAASENVVTGWEENYASGEPIRVESHNSSYLGFQRVPVTGQRVSICINATVFPASLFESAKFDEHSRYGYEEIDIARQAVYLGYLIDFDDRLWVRHYPSPLNREIYVPVQNAARLFLTERAYRVYDGRRWWALLFLIVASAHHLAYAVKARKQVRTAMSAVRSAWSWRRSDIAGGRSAPSRG